MGRPQSRKDEASYDRKKNEWALKSIREKLGLKAEPKKRICLTCRDSFLSFGPQNRICEKHR